MSRTRASAEIKVSVMESVWPWDSPRTTRSLHLRTLRVEPEKKEISGSWSRSDDGMGQRSNDDGWVQHVGWKVTEISVYGSWIGECTGFRTPKEARSQAAARAREIRAEGAAERARIREVDREIEKFAVELEKVARNCCFLKKRGFKTAMTLKGELEFLRTSTSRSLEKLDELRQSAAATRAAVEPVMAELGLTW